jgi:polar amino acid transport system ATP-binding protein/sulfate transport system ATP-binding protein
MQPVERGDTLLRIEDVSLVLQGNTILRNITEEIRDIPKHGQVVGFLGPSGIGKTQLFRIIAGLQEQTTGQVLVGRAQEKVSQGMVGVVAQSYPLFKRRTVLSNLYLGARQGGYVHADALERARSMLDRFNMSDKAELYPAQLSGGQRQRVAIAQQMLCDGHLLLMDEPFSGLDMLMKAEVAKLINEIANMDEANTIIVVTHDVTEAASVADTLWLMGRDRDAEGNSIPGARIQERYCLIERGLAWQPDIITHPKFLDFTREVKQRFMTL